MIKYIALASVVLLVGCSSTAKKPIADDPFYAPVYPDTVPTQVAATGSIYLDSQASSLYSDIRAHRVGDIITVTLKESTQASIDLGYSDSMNTKRESDADQSNSLDGSISANIIQVLSNGNLVIRGEKWISINNGDEFIRVTGMIRSEDINPDNTIDSTRVANARIQYSGTGTFADSQKVGWLSSFFMSDWWPF